MVEVRGVTVLEFASGQDGRVYVAVPDGIGNDDGLVRAGAGERIAQAAVNTWEAALGGIRLVAEGTLVQARSIDPPPEEVEVSFGLAVDGTLGVTLVSSGANAHLTVKVVWRNTAEAAGTATAS